MKIIKKVTWAFRNLVFAFMFAVCMVMGIVPIISKRKEHFQTEIKMEENQKGIGSEEIIVTFKADS